jgi:hypothetical protein
MQSTETKIQNLMDGLLSEMNRVREIIKEYEDPSLNDAGMLAAKMMRMAIAEAESAISHNDVIEMMRQYQHLKTFEL